MFIKFLAGFPLIRHLLAAVIIQGLFCPASLASPSGDFTLKDWLTTAPELKILYAKAIMEQANVHNVHFKQTATFYQAQLDRLALFSQTKNTPQFLEKPIAQDLAIIAVVNCDWENGVAPYEFALRYIGKEQLDVLAGIYPDAIIRLQNNCQ